MIYLLHGSDNVSSRTFLSKLKEQYSEVKVIDCKKLDSKEVTLPQGTMFASKELVVLENFPFKKIENLNSENSYDIAIWTDQEIAAPKWVDKVFAFKQKEQVSSFKFADSIASGQEKTALLALKNLLAENTPGELIIGSLVRQFRLILYSLEGERAKISSSTFLQQKVSEQAKSWTIRRVKSALLLILKTDLGIKGGKISVENAFTLLVFDLKRLLN